MDLERLAITLRPRSAWEATDLGLRLAQRCARSLFPLSALLCLGTVAVCHLLVGIWLGEPDWALLLAWWLKPLLDRALLHVLSHAVFDAQPSLRKTLATLPSLLRHSDLLAALSWRRLDAHRALRLPIAQLEGLCGRAGRERRKLLPRRVAGASAGLLTAFLHFEMLLWFGLLALISMLLPASSAIPPPLQLLFDPMVEPPLWHTSLWAACYALTVAFLEPFYVAAGFALYLKRRTDLEAWDVELQLRRLTPTRLAAWAPLVLCASLLGLPSGDAHAAPLPREAAVGAAPQAIREVLAQPDFGTQETRRTLQWKKPATKQNSAPSQRFKLLIDMLRAVGKFIADSGRLIAWGATAIALCVLLWVLLRHLQGLRLQRRRRPPPPAAVAGLDIRPESLPDDVAAAAQALLAQAQLREALALLYRAALSQLAHRHGVPFASGDTEGDCLLRVTRAGLPAREFFADLTQAWQSVAYARRRPALAHLETLCQRWRETLGSGA